MKTLHSHALQQLEATEAEDKLLPLEKTLLGLEPTSESEAKKVLTQILALELTPFAQTKLKDIRGTKASLWIKSLKGLQSLKPLNKTT